MTERDHHPAGPSALGRLVLCPGSRALVQRALREGWQQPDRSDAESGERVHRWAEMELLRLDPQYDEELLEATTETEMDLAEAFVAFVKEEIEQHGGELWQRVEYRIELVGVNYGWADVVVICRDGTLLVFDLKSGRQVRNLYLSLQLANYGLAARETICGPTGQHGVSIKRVEALAYFPALDHVVRWSSDEVDEYAERQTITELVAQDGGALRPGEHCAHCAAYYGCEARQEQLGRLLALRGTTLPKGSELERVYDGVLVAFDPLRKLVHDRVKAYVASCPGGRGELFEVRETRSPTRTCTDEDALRAALSGVLTEEEFDACLDVNVSRLERAVVARLKAEEGMSDKTGREWFRNRTKECVEQGTVERLQRRKS